MSIKRILLPALIACLIAIGLPGRTASASETEGPEENSRFEVQLDYDKETAVPMYGADLPVEFTVINHGQDYAGLVRICVPVDGDILANARHVEIAENGSAVFTVSLRNMIFDGAVTAMPVRIDILDKEGFVLSSQIKKLEIKSDNSGAFPVGLLTDREGLAEKMSSEPRRLNINYIYDSAPGTDPAIISDDESENVTINFRADRLSDDRFTDENLSLYEYLIIDKTLSGDALTAVRKWLGKGGQAAVNEKVLSSLTTAGPDNNGRVLYGLGTLYVYTDGTEDVQELLSDQQLAALYMHMGDNDAYTFREMASYDIFTKVVSIWPAALLLILYLLLISVVLTKLLDKRKKREHIWFLLPVCALIFFVMIYALGSRVRQHRLFGNYTRMLISTEDVCTDLTVCIVVNPTRQSGSAVLEKDLDLSAIGTSDMFYPENYDYMKERLAGQKIYMTAVASEDAQGILFSPGRAFDRCIFKTEKTEAARGLLSSELDVDNAHLSGSVSNRTEWDLKNVWAICGDFWYHLENLDAGQTISLDNLSPAFYQYNTYDAKWEEMDCEGLHTANSQGAVMLMFSQIQWLADYTDDDLLLVGFTDQADADISLEGSAIPGLTAVMTRGSAGSDDHDYLVWPSSPEGAEDGAVNIYDMSMMTEEAEVVYRLKDTTGIRSVTLYPVPDMLTVTFRNQITGVYETVPDEEGQIPIGALQPYLTPEGTLEVRLEGWPDMPASLPLIYVNGGGGK